MPGDAQLIDYYAKRAHEYERIYEKPERQGDLAALKKLFARSLAGHKVLEIACGTGYWTQPISQTAQSITAIDFNETVLEIARAKEYGCPVDFQKADAFHLPFSPNQFTAAVASHWWSHLRKSEIPQFLSQLHRQFSAGSLMVFMDNRFVAGSSTPLSRTDDEGNTYQWRKLQDGSQHEVLKNFPTETEAREMVGPAAVEFRRTELEYYWFLAYRLK